MPSKNSEQFKGYVEVITWGPKANGGNGLRDQIKSKFYGGNIGHASVRVTIPVDDLGKAEQMIQEHCFHKDNIVIPHEKIKLADGTKAFEVYISAWSNDTITLDNDFMSNSIEEREGVNFNYDEKYKQLFEHSIETRHHTGAIGSTVMNWAPDQIIHQRGNMSPAEFGKYKQIQEYKVQRAREKRMALLENRLINNNKNKLSKTEMLLLDRIDKNWRNQVKNPKKTTFSEHQALIELVEDTKASLMKDGSSVQIKKNIAKIALQEITQLETNIQQDLIKWNCISPSTAQSIIDRKALLGEDIINSMAHYTNLNKQESISLLQNLKMKKIDPSALGIEVYYQNYLPKDNRALEQNFIVGLPPDHIIQLPLQDLKQGSVNVPNALNPEEMLKKAKEIALSGQTFKLTGTNCSYVANSILKAGAHQSKHNHIFTRKALKRFSTPQMVFNNTLEYLRKISPKIDETPNQKSLIQQKKAPADIPGFTAITFEGIDTNLSDVEKAQIFLDRFQKSYDTEKEIPYLNAQDKLALEKTIQGNDKLENQFFKLCNNTLAKAREQNYAEKGALKDEWGIVNAFIEKADNDGKNEYKINRNEEKLQHSYIVLEQDGQKVPYRISRNILGKGAEGKVKALQNEQGEKLSVKILENKAQLDKEISLMKETGAAVTDFVRAREAGSDKRYIVQPLYQGQELQKTLRERDLSNESKLGLALQCAKSLEKIHKQNILHRDVKGANFIAQIDEQGKTQKVNIVDFGGAIKIDASGKIQHTPFGTPNYMAPELGKEDILAAGMKWSQKAQEIAKLGSLMVEANEQLQALQNNKIALKGTQNSTSHLFFEKLPGKKQLVDDNDKEKILSILNDSFLA